MIEILPIFLIDMFECYSFMSKYFDREYAKSEISKLKMILEESQSEKNALIEELQSAKDILTSSVKVSTLLNSVKLKWLLSF